MFSGDIKKQKSPPISHGNVRGIVDGKLGNGAKKKGCVPIALPPQKNYYRLFWIFNR